MPESSHIPPAETPDPITTGLEFGEVEEAEAQKAISTAMCEAIAARIGDTEYQATMIATPPYNEGEGFGSMLTIYPLGSHEEQKGYMIRATGVTSTLTVKPGELPVRRLDGSVTPQNKNGTTLPVETHELAHETRDITAGRIFDPNTEIVAGKQIHRKNSVRGVGHRMVRLVRKNTGFDT